MSQSIDEILAGAVAARRTVLVCFRGDLIEELEQAAAEWDAAVKADQGNAAANGLAGPAALARFRDAVAAADASRVPFTVTDIGGAWGKLAREHPPTLEDTLEGWKWDPDLFPPAALAACCLDPVMTVEQATGVAEKLRDGEWAKLYGAVLALNVADDLIPKLSRSTDVTPDSGPTSTTAPLEGSPSPTSAG